MPQVEQRPHPKSRKLKLSYRPGTGFLLTYPPGTSEKTRNSFLKQSARWMDEVLDSQPAQRQMPSLREYVSAHGLYAEGRKFEVRFENGGSLFNIQGNRILVYPQITEDQLLRKLKVFAKKPLSETTFALANSKQIELKSVTVRDQKSRWGSCSSRGTISLNWRLVLMPESLQKHIILHELAHTIHANHSMRFWKLLQSWDPDFHDHVALLKEMGKCWIQVGQKPISS